MENRRRSACKLDVSNYFNSIDLEGFLPLLRRTLAEEPEACRFLSSLLTEPAVLEGGKPLTEAKGIMTGTPQSAFYANLRCIDRYAQDCLWVIITGKRTKARYDVRYPELKNLGYRSLVHGYYAHRDTD